MNSVSTSGLILRIRPLTETSLIVHWLTPDLGRVATVAKGARRPNSSFRGKLDLFYEADFSFVRSRRSELHTLREVSLHQTHSRLREDLHALQQAAYCTALVEQTATMVFMPNARARAEDYCDGFALSAHELDVIRTLPAHSHCFLVRQADASVVVRLDLAGMPEVLTVLSGRESTVRKLDALRAQYGDAPAAWYPALTGAQWPGEAGESGEELLRWTEAAE